jgi:hypothetical protein
VSYVNHFKVILRVCFVSLDSAGGYLLSDIEEYAGRGNVVTGAGVERIGVWGVMVQ